MSRSITNDKVVDFAMYYGSNWDFEMLGNLCLDASQPGRQTNVKEVGHPRLMPS